MSRLVKAASAVGNTVRSFYIIMGFKVCKKRTDCHVTVSGTSLSVQVGIYWPQKISPECGCILVEEKWMNCLNCQCKYCDSKKKKTFWHYTSKSRIFAMHRSYNVATSMLLMAISGLSKRPRRILIITRTSVPLMSAESDGIGALDEDSIAQTDRRHILLNYDRCF